MDAPHDSLRYRVRRLVKNAGILRFGLPLAGAITVWDLAEHWRESGSAAYAIGVTLLIEAPLNLVFYGIAGGLLMSWAISRLGLTQRKPPLD